MQNNNTLLNKSIKEPINKQEVINVKPINKKKIVNEEHINALSNLSIKESINKNNKEEFINDLSYQPILDKLTLCNCCEKHKINKPKLYVKWVDTPNNKGINSETSNTNPFTGKLYCKCDCRHNARWICRNIS